MICGNCGISASREVQEMINEGGYEGDYFCSDECRNEAREREDKQYGEY